MSEIEEELPISIVNDETFRKGIRVMAVDDDLFCLKFLQMQLVSCGYVVDASQDPVSALDRLRKNKGNYDLVITDVRMPIMDGFQLSRIIDYEMGLPVVLISGDGEVNTVLEGIKHNASDYLLKPIRMEELKLIWKHVVMKSRQKTKCFYPSIKPDNESEPKDENITMHSMIMVNKQVEANKNDTPNPRRKGKENGLTYEVDASCQDSSKEVTSTRKMARLYWEPQLHNKFVVAFNKLGWDKATAKRVYNLMDVPGITRKHVASHLQTYKKKLEKNDECSKQRPSNLSSIGFGANSVDSSSLPFNGQIPNLDTVSCQNHLNTTLFTRHQSQDSMNGVNNSMFLPSTTNQQSNFRENNSTRSEIRIFGKPQLASNLSLVPRERKPATHMNNNFSSSTYQPWFSPSTRR